MDLSGRSHGELYPNILPCMSNHAWALIVLLFRVSQTVFKPFFFSLHFFRVSDGNTEQFVLISLPAFVWALIQQGDSEEAALIDIKIWQAGVL